MSLVEVGTLRKVLDLPEAAASDAELQQVIDATEQAVMPLLNDDDHSVHENCREALLGMSVQVWQSRHAPGGQMVGVDLNPQATPHLLGPGLIQRFMGELGPCTPYGGAVIA